MLQFPVIVIGASTGGPSLVHSILDGLPADLPAAILIAQHMPVVFTRQMAKGLDKHCAMQVKLAELEDRIEPKTVLVAPGDQHMSIVRNDKHLAVVDLVHDDNELMPSIDITMENAAKIFGKRVTGILLTGMGKDGGRGMRAIKEHGGATIVQSPESCVVDSMPTNVIKSGDADTIMHPDNIAKHIIKIVKK